MNNFITYFVNNKYIQIIFLSIIQSSRYVLLLGVRKLQVVTFNFIVHLRRLRGQVTI